MLSHNDICLFYPRRHHYSFLREDMCKILDCIVCVGGSLPHSVGFLCGEEKLMKMLQSEALEVEFPQVKTTQCSVKDIALTMWIVGWQAKEIISNSQFNAAF